MSSNMTCPQCGSHNIVVQREQSGNVGFSHGRIGTQHHHGLLYWLCVGWWIWIFKLIFLPFKLLFGHKHKGIGNNNISMNKTFNETVAVCQDCGHTWKV